MESIHQFDCLDIVGNPISLKDYKGKVLLIVNTASACGFTPQYSQLQNLYEEMHDKGFEILAFPSNDFSNQEPLEGRNLQVHCNSQFNVAFPIMEKIHVKGNRRHEIYKFLSNKHVNGLTSLAPIWNFHKYLIDKNGYVRDYFLTTTSPNSIKVKSKIIDLLKE